MEGKTKRIQKWRKWAPNESLFGELFVPGEPAYIIVNLSVEKNTNRLPVEYHPVSFPDNDFKSEVFKTSMCYEYGSIITIARIYFPTEFRQNSLTTRVWRRYLLFLR